MHQFGDHPVTKDFTYVCTFTGVTYSNSGIRAVSTIIVDSCMNTEDPFACMHAKAIDERVNRRWIFGIRLVQSSFCISHVFSSVSIA